MAIALGTLLVACAGCPPRPPPGGAGGASGIPSVDEGDAVREAPTPEPASDAGPRAILSPPGGQAFEVRLELARTDPEQERGLMFRRSLDEDAGMLFVYETMEHRSFWMENTYISLDMVFIDDTGRVVGVVEDAAPHTRDAREVDGLSQYVLEVNAGFARRHGVVRGTPVRFVGVEGHSGAGDTPADGAER